MDKDRNSQAPYLMFRVEKIHGDKAVLNIQNWLEKNFNEEISVGRLADKSGMTRRTFERRFKHATGDSPCAIFSGLELKMQNSSLKREAKHLTKSPIWWGMRAAVHSSGFLKRKQGFHPFYTKKSTVLRLEKML